MRRRRSVMGWHWGMSVVRGLFLCVLCLAWNDITHAQANKPTPSSQTTETWEGGQIPPSTVLFQREPLGFDLRTWRKFLIPMQRPTDFFATTTHVVQEEWQKLGSTGALLLGFCVLVIVAALASRRRVATTGAVWEEALRTRTPTAYAPLLSATLRIAVAAFLPLAILLAFLLARALTGQDGRVVHFVTRLLVLWTSVTLFICLAREVLLSPLIPAAHGATIFRLTRLIVVYVACGLALLWSGTMLHLPPDVLSLIRFFFILTAGSSIFLLWTRKEAIFSLFPQLPNRLYQRFLVGLHRAYKPILFLTFTTGLLWALGYRNLAGFLWQRSWALAAVFLVAVFLHHVALRWVRHWTAPGPFPTEAALAFQRAMILAVTAIITGAGLLFAFGLTGLLTLSLRILAVPLLTVGATPFSLLLLIQAVVIASVFLLSSRLLRTYLDYRVYPAVELDLGVAAAINTFLAYALGVMGLLIGLRMVGLDLQALTIFAGALGIGAGFGLQSLTSDIASGLTLIFGRALRRGDFVKMNEAEGFVQEIGVRSTRLRTTDDVELLTPNSQLVSNTITNYSHTSPLFRLHVPVGVSYDSDPERVKEVLLEVAQRCTGVETRPAPDVWFVELSESALVFELLVWINVRRLTTGQVKSALYFDLFRALKVAGIEFPFPQHDIHIRSSVALGELLHKDGEAAEEDVQRKTKDE